MTERQMRIRKRRKERRQEKVSYIAVNVLKLLIATLVTFVFELVMVMVVEMNPARCLLLGEIALALAFATLVCKKLFD